MLTPAFPSASPRSASVPGRSSRDTVRSLAMLPPSFRSYWFPECICDLGRTAAGGPQEDPERHERRAVEEGLGACPLSDLDLIRLLQGQLPPSAVADPKESRSSGCEAMKPDARPLSLPDGEKRYGDLLERS